MNHDVFISYSSKNSAAAQAICHQLEDNNIKCWMAPRDIPVGAKYASVITQAIKECKAVVLVFSEYSAISPWVESEINIAFSNRKPIVPYKIDTTPLENYDEFYLMLNNRHWIEAYPDFKTRFADLVTVISNLVGAKTSNVTKPTPTPAKTYKVGDYYNDGVREGVVFEVSADGRHGKIVSMKQSAEGLQWSSDGAEQECLIGANSETNGAYNMAKVKAISGWRDKYPAFKWCADLGEGWYLPAKEELLTIYKYKDKLNPKLTDKLPERRYWSSTEYDYQWSSGEFCAWIVFMYNGSTYYDPKRYNYYVRAVATFGEDILEDDIRVFVEMERKAQNKKYKVGDYYNDGVREGVVFEVSANGRHGKIVSLKQSAGRLQWSSDSAERNRLIGADSETDGVYNMAKVKSISGWREKYPAFKWCADLGEGWYLPSIEELKVFTRNTAVHDAVNRTLLARNGTKLYNRGEHGWYWSSTEVNEQIHGNFCAWNFHLGIGFTLYDYKSNRTYVRAVSAF